MQDPFAQVGELKQLQTYATFWCPIYCTPPLLNLVAETL